ncbi:hypothetical protein AVEN_212420-1 [Araneus ventricosus]|uniref:Uncharacterized protein n=1 Tax=Araneus ventricosus TaxID=182803 RepID=A0A4Y2P521_ARAVE|nr:hypothetical protein AVEN_196713-1 [Araneus ventricosus]GBN47167.1 hypothetical protein AVEN_212420-1 [Araneus ventricosus]
MRCDGKSLFQCIMLPKTSYRLKVSICRKKKFYSTDVSESLLFGQQWVKSASVNNDESPELCASSSSNSAFLSSQMYVVCARGLVVPDSLRSQVRILPLI